MSLAPSGPPVALKTTSSDIYPFSGTPFSGNESKRDIIGLKYIDTLGAQTFDDIKSQTPVLEDTWNHVVVTFNNSNTTAKIYINGKEDASDTSMGKIPFIARNSGLVGHGQWDDYDRFRIAQWNLNRNQSAWC